MKPAPFDYLRAMNAQHALDALAQHGEDARVLAGGQSLMAVLNMAAPTRNRRTSKRTPATRSKWKAR